MKKIRRLLAVILICVFCVGVCPLASAAEPLPGSTDLYLLSENNSDGQAKLLGKTVTVEGIVTVASGVWHDQVNYFSIVTPRDSYRFGGGTLIIYRYPHPGCQPNLYPSDSGGRHQYH